MSVEILDGATIVHFLEDKEAFNSSIGNRFARLDTNNDGLLSYEEMLKELQGLRVFETHFGIDVESDPDELARVYESLFVQFDHNLNGTVDLEEFKKETKQMMLAMADGMGFLPIQMVLEEDSILKLAVEREYNNAAA
jgi:Ca2+-binding EF-hand superfamily protein